MVSHLLHPLYSFAPKMMFGSGLVQCSKCKRCKTCDSGVNALFRGTEVAKIVSHQMHQFYSIRPKMVFGCVLEHFGNFRNVKGAKLVFQVCILGYRSCENCFAPNTSILLH
jgi:hypothetical protein